MGAFIVGTCREEVGIDVFGSKWEEGAADGEIGRELIAHGVGVDGRDVSRAFADASELASLNGYDI